jgi:hypothetical protein
MKMQPADRSNKCSFTSSYFIEAKVIAVFIMCLLWSQVWAADSTQLGEAEPTDYLMPIPPDCGPYRVLLSEKLELDTGNYTNCGRMVYCPAFKGESAVTVCGDYGSEVPIKSRSFHIRVLKANQNIWYSMPGHSDALNLQNLKILTKDVPIDGNVAIAVQRAWTAMLLKTRYPVKDSGDLRDGFTAEFSVADPNSGMLYGEIRSPKNGWTKELVDLGLELVDFCDLKQEQRAAREKELLVKLARLMKEIDGKQP